MHSRYRNVMLSHLPILFGQLEEQIQHQTSAIKKEVLYTVPVVVFPLKAIISCAIFTQKLCLFGTGIASCHVAFPPHNWYLMKIKENVLNSWTLRLSFGYSCIGSRYLILMHRCWFCFNFIFNLSR